MLTTLCGTQALSPYLMNIFLAIYDLSIGNYNLEIYELPLKISSPFNRATYIGFFATLVTNLVLSLTHAMAMITVVGYFCASCSYIEACVLHLYDKIANISQLHKTAKDFLSQANERLSDAISFHIKIIK